MRTDQERAQDMIELLRDTRLGDPVRVLMDIGPLEVELAGTFNGLLDGDAEPSVLVGGLSGMPAWLVTPIPIDYVRPSPVIVTAGGVRIRVGAS